MHWVFCVCLAITWAATGVVGTNPQGHNVSFYFWSCSLSGRVANGMCCDVNRSTNCPAGCDVHFVVCIRDHNETSDVCNSATSSHISFLHYAYLDRMNITFFEGDNVFGVGLHNPLVYSFSGNWSKRIQTVLIARDFDFDFSFTNIDYIDVNWTVPAGREVDNRTYVGVYMNMVVELALKVDCWEGWHGEYCTVFCVARDDSGGHYTCNTNGTKECLFGWTGITCNTSITTCSPPCVFNRRCEMARCDTCASGYAGANCSCIPESGCDLTGGFCQAPMECRCHTGYHGAHCEHLNYCARWGNPCLNSGNCVSMSNDTFGCECPSGYSGQRCEVRICPNTACPSAPALPCSNGGVCRNATSGTACECANGYTGPCCDAVIDNCQNNPCDQGRCTNAIGDYICECDSGYQGKNCSQDVDECARDSPCQNGGQCSNRLGHYFCYCPLNYTGVNCTEHVSSCGSVACEGGACVCQCAPQCDQGRCLNSVPSGPPVYRCVCQAGFNGTTCDHNINDCRGQCENGAACADRINGYTCHCPSGFAGERCQEDVVECERAPCMNGGVCMNSIGSYSCMCPQAYTGGDCDTFVQLSYCAMDNPCQNGGQCQDEMFGTSCECGSEYNGTHCEYFLDPCSEISCSNGGVCEEGRCQCREFYTREDCSEAVDVCGTQLIPSDCPADRGTCLNTPDTSTGYTCRCETGYNGAKCENDINDCAGNPCGDNGACSDLLNGFACDCTTGYSGELCGQIIDNCQSSPCLNGGSCQNAVNTFSCECPADTVPPVCQLTASCSRTSCSNHGECQGDGIEVAVSCECDTGYTGQFCDTLVNLCDSSPCQKGATCYQGIGSYACRCDSETADPDCSDQTLSNTQGVGLSAELIPTILGVSVGVLATLVVVLTVAMVCHIRFRRRRRQEVLMQHLDAGVASNPVYAGMDGVELPTYMEVRGGDVMKTPLEDTIPPPNIYEGVSELKQDIMDTYGVENRGFEDVAEEKKALEAMYENLK